MRKFSIPQKFNLSLVTKGATCIQKYVIVIRYSFILIVRVIN